MALSLLTALLLASGTPLDLGPEIQPGPTFQMLRFEPVALGAGALGIEPRLLKATYRYDRYRVGITALELSSVISEYESMALLPVHVGFTLWSNPREANLGFGHIYGMVPDIYLELSASPLSAGFRYEPSYRLSACCDVDYCGLGLGVEAGRFSRVVYEGHPVPNRRLNSWYFGVRAKAFVAGIGL